ncbi:hypothetical protein [Litoreibacter janthinus]|uniref:Polysaccharide lyase n=1 Tax=Litoreibacter janthinus TaxID=670154 RepID=A0A1I6FUQ7_9RHOB|nr:hypothetical protein [Litoreibacter janthinus]SFR33695.1 hypothetical protein SAMN04488002_0364 [Litoreibacter janthinus]
MKRFFYTLFSALMLSAPANVNAADLMNYNVASATELSQLFPKSGRGFTNIKSTYDDNKIQMAGGSVAMRAVKRPSGSSKVSKASLVHEGFEARQGDILKISLRIKINPGNADGLYFMDLECTTCWPPIAPVSNQSPGIRMYIDRSNGRLGIDRGKIGFRSQPMRSPGPRFPIGEWVDVVWKIGLSESSNGWVEVKTNGRLLLQAKGATLPSRSTFLKYGILLSALKYDYVEVGATANETGRDQTVQIASLRIQKAAGGF